MSELNESALDEVLHDLVKWESFALHLPKITKSDIDKIPERMDLDKQRIALYTKWLQVHPNASWDDVVKALENPAVRQNKIAKRVKDKYCKYDKVDSQVSSGVSPGQSLMTTENNEQSTFPVSTDSTKMEEVVIDENVVMELNSLEQSFCDLAGEVKKAVKEAEREKGDKCIQNITFNIKQARSFHIDSLKSVKTTDDLFEAIHPHYNFLNCHLIIRIALFLCGIVADKATKYKEDIMKFMKTTKITNLKGVLKQFHRQRQFLPQDNSSIIVEIKVENVWGEQPLWLVEMLVETLFPVKDHRYKLPWYDIVPGSIVMTFVALEHMKSSLIESSRKKTEFMRLMGVISLKIGDELVWHRKDLEDIIKSFEESLIRATVADNFEAAQFILQYTQRVNINTRNTNLRLNTDKETAYVKELECEITLEIFHSVFKNMLKKCSANTPCDNFLNGRISSIKGLSEEDLAKVGKYNEMINGVKRAFQVQYLQNILCMYFPTPFQGSIKVIITLHSVWNTCSVWYVEQLGQLIFTPTLFYHQLHWYRVDMRQDDLIKICLLADGEVKNQLRDCISENKFCASMLGVLSLQIDDETVMVSNDWDADGYTFDKAIKLAKKIANGEISNLLQQIWLSPIDYKSPSTPHDMNNNICFRPHPDSTPLMIACCNNNSQLVQLLLDHNGTNPNIQNGRGVTALMYSTGNTKIFQMLLDHGADIKAVSSNNFTPMHFACLTGNEEVVKVLIKKDKEQVFGTDRDGENPLMIASRYGHPAVVKLLLQANTNPNDQDGILGWTALQGASAFGHKDVVKLLLEEQAKPNIQNGVGSTALQVASKSGYKDIVELLLEAGANPNIQDNEGQTALIHACAHGHIGVVSELLFHDYDQVQQANPNLTDRDGWTALEVASWVGHKNIVELLLQARAKPEINHQDDNGRTALMWACKEGHIPIVELLLQANANPNLQDKEQWTALEAVELNGNDHTRNVISKLLCQAQTDQSGGHEAVLPQAQSNSNKKGQLPCKKKNVTIGFDSIGTNMHMFSRLSTRL